MSKPQAEEEPAVREEYNVGMPKENEVYYDTVLDTTMTVHEAGEDYVTYAINQEIDNVHSDPIDKFLAWLAAERFVKLGRRDDERKLVTSKSDLERVFSKRYGVDLRDYDTFEVAMAVMTDDVNEHVECEDRL